MELVNKEEGEELSHVEMFIKTHQSRASHKGKALNEDTKCYYKYFKI